MITLKGVSESGKSSIVIDTISIETRRKMNKTYPLYIQNVLPKYGVPKDLSYKKSKDLFAI